MRTTLPESDAEILNEIVESRDGDLPPAVARSLLKWRFSRAAVGRIRTLLRKNNAGTLSADEQAALERYLRIGQLLDLLHAKSHLSLSRAKQGR
jgi:hypothetical protein